jgi:hypothetical protein
MCKLKLHGTQQGGTLSKNKGKINGHGNKLINIKYKGTCRNNLI